MDDHLKEHIKKNRQDFEIHSHDYVKIWNSISQSLDRKKSHTRPGYHIVLKIAAAILILVTVGIAFVIGRKSAEVNRNGIALKNISIEMAETEAYYTSLIEDKLEIIKTEDPDFSLEFWESIEQLDKDYTQLKKDFKDQADNKKVIEAMINYYRLKLKMLEQISKELKEKSNENENINI